MEEMIIDGKYKMGGNTSYHNTWRFIEENLPNYSSRDDVLLDDILLRYIEGDDVSEEDLEWIEAEFHNDNRLIKEEIIRLETGFMNESLQAYYNL